MRRNLTIWGLAIALGLPAVAAAQEWELGGMASYGFYKNQSVVSPSGTAVTGFSPGYALGGVIGYGSPNRWLGGEFRYTYRDSPLKLSAKGTDVKFNGVAHVIHYDLIIHRPQRRSHVQPFVAVGGGMKVYRGTGDEVAYQPLSNFALLTKTQDVRPVISAGAGVKFQVTPRLAFRAEFRDYITPFPTRVITPLPGNSVSGWVNDFVPMFGLSYTF